MRCVVQLACAALHLQWCLLGLLSVLAIVTSQLLLVSCWLQLDYSKIVESAHVLVDNAVTCVRHYDLHTFRAASLWKHCFQWSPAGWNS
jgi:hypothetical protein